MTRTTLWAIVIIIVFGCVSVFVSLYLLTGNTDMSGNYENTDFRSNTPCESSSNCFYNKYPMCFEGYCVSVNDSLRDYIFSNYNHGNVDKIIEYNDQHIYGFFENDGSCEDIACETCAKGSLTTASIGYNNYEIRYCIECTDRFAKCLDGYDCTNGKCIDSEY